MTLSTIDLESLAIEDLMIPSDTPGIDLHLRHKRRRDTDSFSAERTVLLVHGATYGSECLFDVRLDGMSFLDHLAHEGFDVYALDVRGYGGSTRPPEMDASPEHHPPLGGIEVGVRDLTAAVDAIRKRRGLDRLNLVAMSWGGSVAGAYASQNGDAVVRLALVAPLWVREGSSTIDAGGPLGSYRSIVVGDMETRWLGAAPENKRAALLPPGWFETWAGMALASDPLSAETGTLRAVNGPVLDIRNYWSAGRPYYDPSSIAAPVLLVHAEWDRDVPIEAAQAFFLKLTGARYRRWVEIGEGTHMILLERNRMQAFEAVSGFLKEPQ